MKKNTITILSVFILTMLFFSFKRDKDYFKKDKSYYVLSNEICDNADSSLISCNLFNIRTHKAIAGIFGIEGIKKFLTDDNGYFKIRVKSGVYKFTFAIMNPQLVTKKITIDTKHNYHFTVYLDSHTLY